MTRYLEVVCRDTTNGEVLECRRLVSWIDWRQAQHHVRGALLELAMEDAIKAVDVELEFRGAKT